MAVAAATMVALAGTMVLADITVLVGATVLAGATVSPTVVSVDFTDAATSIMGVACSSARL